MIIELLVISLLFVSFTGWGIWINFFLSVKNNSLPLTVLSGLAFFSILTCLIAFFMPLKAEVEIFLITLSVLPFLIKRLRIYSVQIHRETFKSVFFWVFCLIILFAGSYFPFRPDHFWYYIPSLNWLNQYGLITGIANIDWILGQMSSLHIVQAGLDQILDPFQRIDVFISIIFLVYIFDKKAYWLLLFIPFQFLFIQTASPDVAVVFLSLIVVNELCFNYDKNKFAILLIISFFVFTIRPVGFWLPAWVYITGIYHNKKEWKSYKNYVFPLLLLFIFIIKNIVISSTFCYPLTFLKLNTYWLTDQHILDLSNQSAALYTFDMHYTIEEIGKFSFLERVYRWLTLPDLQVIINLFIVIVTLLFGIYAFWKKCFTYKALWTIIFLKIVLIFCYSGQYRFMLDGIYPLLFILIVNIRIKKQIILVGSMALFLAFLGLISFPEKVQKVLPGFMLSDYMTGFTKKALLRPENYILPEYKSGRIGNLDFNISEMYLFSFDTPIPAFAKHHLKILHRSGVFPQMKDSTDIRKGFYMKPFSEEENTHLKEILSSDK